MSKNDELIYLYGQSGAAAWDQGVENSDSHLNISFMPLPDYNTEATMAKIEQIPFKQQPFLQHVDTISVSTEKSGNSFSLSHYSDRKYKRSKSLPQVLPEQYSAGDIRRIRERLLRTTRLEPSAIKNFTAVQKMTLASLAMVDFFCFCSVSIMAPFFPQEAGKKGMSATMSGFVFSFYALVMFITSPILGKILPKVGPRFLFLSGIFVAGSCNLLFGTLQFIYDYNTFTISCFLVRGFEALGASAFSTASYVFVVNKFPNNVGSVIGILETCIGLGMSTGPVIGGFLYTLGGFSLPFFALGVAMVAIVPLNMWLLPMVEDFDHNISSKSTSIFKLLGVPAVFVTGMVVVVISSVWSFLDPTLEPHLSQFNLTAGKVGLVFLLFSGLYGISSPVWGWLADKVNNHWSMMVVGLFLSTVGLLLLGPCPFIPGIPKVIWLNLLSLSILGVSVALALMPTFQAVLSSAVNGGCSDTIATYSLVAGIWSSMYSLGEVIGPALGGFLLQHYDFPLAATTMAASTFFMGTIALFFFSFKSNVDYTDASSDSGISASWKTTEGSESSEEFGESSPLLMSAGVPSSSYRAYTEEKLQYYEMSRKQDTELGDVDPNQLTDVRATVTVTSRGACEV